jgi:hypothetical protein
MPLVAYASGDAMMPAAHNETKILFIFMKSSLID